MIKWLKYNKQFIIATVIFSIFGTGVAFGLPYIPSDAMLDPTCAPGDANCYVSFMISYGGGAVTSNLAIGNNSLFANTTGYGNTAAGYNSLASNTTAVYNTAFGYQALKSNTTGNDNTAIGKESLYNNTTGYFNTSVGYGAMYNNTTGYENTAVGGFLPMLNNTTGFRNVSVGTYSLVSNTTGSYNTVVGNDANSQGTTTSYNTAVGYQSLRNNLANSNVAVGYQSLYSNTSGNENTSTGYRALYLNTTGVQNTAFGYNVLNANNANGNTAFGYNSMSANTGGVDNTAVGKASLSNNTNGASNTALGVYALINNTSGNGNTALGVNALWANDTSGYNTAVGTNALFYNSSGLYNTGIGGNVLYNNTNGNYNIGMGLNSLRSNIDGSSNVSLGYQAGYNTGASGTLQNNILIGYQAADNIDDGAGNNIIIGYDIDLPTANGDNQLSIGNLIFGTSIDGTGTTLSSGNIGIGIASPNVKLDVMTATGDANIRVAAASGAAQFTMQDVAGTNQTLLDLREGSWPGTVNYRIGGYSQSAAANAGQFYFQNRVNNTGYISFFTTTGGSLTEKIRVINSGNLGIGDTTPASLFTVGSGDLFQVNSSGDIVKINNITYTWPASQAGASGYVLTNNGSGTLTWAAASGGVTTLGAIGSSPNANGGTISGVTLNLEPASASFGGVVTTGTQTFAGAKTFSATSLVLSSSAAEIRFSTASMDTGIRSVAGDWYIHRTASTGVTPYSNIGIGNSLNSSATGDRNISIGDNTMLNLSSGQFNVAIGASAAQPLSTGYSNVAINKDALRNISTSNNNISIGESSGFSITTSGTSGGNVLMGSAAGYSLVGFRNVVIGQEAMASEYLAGAAITTSSDNVYLGYHAAVETIGTDNVGIGNQVFGSQSLTNTTADQSIGIGYRALYTSTSGTGNTSIGYGTGLAVTNGDYNILLGWQSGDALTTGSKNIIIGYNIDVPSNTTDGQLSIGNLIFGTAIDGTGTTVSTGSIGIGDASPDYRFDVDGDVATSYVGGFFNDGNNDNRYGIVIQAGADTPTANRWIQFNDGDGTDQGSICYTGGQANICAPSDMRLKKDIVDTSIGLNSLLNIKVRDFVYISDGENRVVHGFIAQELFNIYPDAVSKPINENEMWKVSYNQLTPLIIKSIQDLDLKVNDLSSLDTAKENSLAKRIQIFLSDVGNGIEKIFAKEIETKNLCVSDSSGEKTCITKSQLDVLLQNANINTVNTQSNSTENSVAASEDKNTQENQNTEENTDNTTVETPPITEIIPEIINPDLIVNTETITE